MSDGRRPVLLLVDDEPRILSALRRALRREGYELLLAETASEALHLIDTETVDCVLSDHKMPGLTGLQVLERVATRQPKAARLLITGCYEELDAAELARLEVHAVLGKPWDDDELKKVLRESLASAPRN